MQGMPWPYANEAGLTETLSCDVLVLGGGLAGCFAAIAAAKKGRSVILVEKGATERSGAAGSGFDHWESACTNPASRVTAEEIAWLKAAKERGTWLAVALVDDGDAAKFEARRESLRALRCVDRVLPVSDWADLKAAVQNLRIDLIVTRPERAEAFTEHAELGAEVIVQ